MRRYRRGQIRFIRIGASGAAVSLLLGAIFTTAYASRTGIATAAVPTYGGTITERFPDAPDCLDPQKTATASSYTIDSSVFDSLLSIDNKGHYVGNLATKYKSSNGGLRLTFFLRPGVKFSNGDPFTASAVKFTFDRAQNPATKSPVTAGFLSQVADTKVINKLEVRLDLKGPFRPLLTNLARAETGILDPKVITALGTDTCEKPVGTGPYKIQSVGPAFDTITLTANSHHNFGPSWVHNKGKPYISKIVYKTIESDSTAVSLLLSGGIDIIGIPGTQLNRVQGNKKIIIHKSEAQSLIFLEFNTAHPPFNNVEVRKAVAALIDRKAIIKAALNGQGKAVNGPVAPTLPYYDKKAAKLMPAFDVNAAAKVIAANHAAGPYTLLTPSVPTYSTLSEILQANAGQAGMKLNIVSKTLADFIPAAGKGDFDMLTLDYAYSDPDVLYFLLASSQGHGAGLNWTNFVSPTLDSLLQQGRTTLNSKKAAKIYNKLQEYVNTQLIFLGVADPISLVGIRSTIKGYHINRTGQAAIQDFYIRTK